MINGHGDDIHNYDGVTSNFSSNIYGGFAHDGLFCHIGHSLPLVTYYPEPTPLSLERRIAEDNGVGTDCVMVTNGATEAIYLIAMAYRHREAVIPQPAFSEYADACRISGCTFRMDDGGDTVDDGDERIWWLCIPNNPTGCVMPKRELLDMVASHLRDIFVVDASYAAYTRHDVISAREAVDCGNVLMLGSMTKEYGIPGLRLGYLIGPESLIDTVRRLRMPWSVNALAIEAGHYLLDHRAEYVIPLDMLIAERRRIEPMLHGMGITTAHSDSHMLLCRLPHGSAAELKEWLVRHHGILIRDASNFATLSPQHFRIAVQTEQQNDNLIMAIRQWIS